jgi:hypothetical protein
VRAGKVKHVLDKEHSLGKLRPSRDCSNSGGVVVDEKWNALVRAALRCPRHPMSRPPPNLPALISCYRCSVRRLPIQSTGREAAIRF